MYWTSMLPFKTRVSLSGSVRLLLIHSSTCTILAVPHLSTLSTLHTGTTLTHRPARSARSRFTHAPP